jgi:hypothetical protein
MKPPARDSPQMNDLFAAIEREVIRVADDLGDYWGRDVPLTGPAWELVSVPLPHSEIISKQARWLVTLEQLSNRARVEWCGPGVPFDAVQTRLKALLAAVFSLTLCAGGTREEVWFQYVQRCREVERALLEVRDLATAARGRALELVDQAVQGAELAEPATPGARGRALQSGTSVAPTTVPELTIRLVGEVWHLRFHTERGDYPAPRNKCLGWLAKLLSKPHHRWTVAELYGDSDDKLAADALIVGEAVMDQEALRRIKNRIEDIDQYIDDGLSTETLETEKEDLLKQLKPYARKERMDSPIAKAYNNITTQIRQFRQKVKAGMPGLEAHLRASIKPDASDFSIVYCPPSGTPLWHVENR